MLKKWLHIIFSLLIIMSSHAQGVDRYLAFGPSTTSYRGDLNSNYSKLGGAINVLIVPEREKLIQTSLELNIGKISGQKSDFYSENHPEYEPNSFFQTNFTSFSFNIRAYLIKKGKLKVYISQGIGAIRYVPKDINDSLLVEQPETRFEGENYGNLALILPRSIGVTYKLKNDYRLGFDINQQTPMTDYIDNVSVLGNPDKKDKILLFRFSVMIPIILEKEQREQPISDASGS